MKPSLKIFVVEDDPLLNREICLMLEEIGYQVVGSAEQPADAMAKIAAAEPELLLLDINLNSGINGIQLAAQVKDQFGLPFIYLTGNSDAMTLDQAKATEPLAFVVKPFARKNLESAIEIAFHNFLGQGALKDAGPALNQKFFFVRHKGEMLRLDLESILFVEAMDNYSRISTANGRYVVPMTLKAMEKRLDQPYMFRVHRSFVVNLNKIDSIQDNRIRIGTDQVTIGKSYKERFARRIELL